MYAHAPVENDGPRHIGHRVVQYRYAFLRVVILVYAAHPQDLAGEVREDDSQCDRRKDLTNRSAESACCETSACYRQSGAELSGSTSMGVIQALVPRQSIDEKYPSASPTITAALYPCIQDHHFEQ